MNAPIDTSRRPAPEVLAAVLGELATRFGDRAVVNASVREQHGHGEGLADAALPDVVVFPHTNDEVAAIGPHSTRPPALQSTRERRSSAHRRLGVPAG